MFERASSETWQALDFFFARSGLRGTRAAEKRAMKSLSCEFSFRGRRFRFHARTDLRLGDDHVVVAADT